MKKFDVYSIGNALVDSEYQVSDALLAQAGVEKRHMTLIDAPRRAEILQHMHGVSSHRTGGGSAGNTIVAVAQFGGKAFTPAAWPRMNWALFMPKTCKTTACKPT